MNTDSAKTSFRPDEASGTLNPPGLNTSFGPWSTHVDSQSRARLSRFWKRRLATLARLRGTATNIDRRAFCALAGFGAAAGLLPMLRFASDRAGAAAGGEGGEASKPVTLPGHLNVMALVFSKDGKTLISVATEKSVTVRYWDLKTAKLKKEVKLDTKHHGNRFAMNGSLRISADAKTVIGVSGGKLGVWNSATGKQVVSLEAPRFTLAGATAVTDDGRFVAASGTLRGFPRPDDPVPVFVWKVEGSELLNTLGHVGALQIHHLAFSPSGRMLASASQEAGTLVWDTKTWKPLCTIANDNDASKYPGGPISPSAARQVLCLAFSPDDDELLAAGDVFGVKLYEVRTGRHYRTIEAPFRFNRCRLLFSPDGGLLARVAADKTVFIWNVESGRLVHELETDSNCGAFSPDGKRFAVGFSDRKQAIKVWRLR